MKCSLIEAINFLRDGKVVAIPTDTVYGLAATKKEPLFTLKQRDPNRRLIICTDSMESALSLIDYVPPGGRELMEAYWPGPLTLVFSDDLAIRVPAYPLDLLKQTGPLFVTSANLSGHPPLTTPEEISATFPSLPILEGTISNQDLPSTILRFNGSDWEALRIGSLKKWALPRTLKETEEKKDVYANSPK